MSAPRHLFVCIHLGTSGRPGCGVRGGVELLHTIRLAKQPTELRITSSGCLGGCSDGPNAVIYPDGSWYNQLNIDDVPALLEQLNTGAIAPSLAAKHHEFDNDGES
jgi:(2Fe-2S) ferredoxin